MILKFIWNGIMKIIKNESNNYEKRQILSDTKTLRKSIATAIKEKYHWDRNKNYSNQKTPRYNVAI